MCGNSELASLKRGGGVQTVRGQVVEEERRIEVAATSSGGKANGPPTQNQFRSELFLSRSRSCAF